jgi:hypothetical protein
MRESSQACTIERRLSATYRRLPVKELVGQNVVSYSLPGLIVIGLEISTTAMTGPLGGFLC